MAYDILNLSFYTISHPFSHLQTHPEPIYNYEDALKRINVFNGFLCFSLFLFLQVITWFQNRRAKMKRDMEELKKDVESVKALTGPKGFLENITDMNLLKTKNVPIHDDSFSPQKL